MNYQVAPDVGRDMPVDLIKLPPHSVEAEQSVLGGLLLENSAWDRIADQIAEGDFYRHDHRLIYRHISRLIEQSRPADVVTVAESLEKSNELNQIGGLAYLAALAQNTPSAANIRRYAEIVRERSIMRRLVEVGTEISDSAYNPQGREASQLLDQGARSAAGLGGERGLGKGDGQECSRGIARQRAKIQGLAAPGLGMGGKLRAGCAVAGVGQLFESSVRDAQR